VTTSAKPEASLGVAGYEQRQWKNMANTCLKITTSCTDKCMATR